MWLRTPLIISLLSRRTSSAPLFPQGEWLIPNTSFSSQTQFTSFWDYNYPWGTDLNGGARMNSSQVSLQDGQLKLTARPVLGQPPTGSGIPIHYLSGTVYAKQPIMVGKGQFIHISGKFKAPTEQGTWPAVWLTGQDSWPPEIDLAEWKGDGNVSFSCVDVNNDWSSDDVLYPDSEEFHDIYVNLRDYDGVDVRISYHLDDVLRITHMGKQMVGAPFWLIIDYQMEGSSGSPGPTYDTYFMIKDFSILSFNLLQPPS